jgi:hypothetical protein
MNGGALSAIVAVSFLGSSLAFAQETERLKERAREAAEAIKDATKEAVDAVARETHETWAKTKAYFSNDPDTYRYGAEQKLNELGAEIAELRKHSGDIKEPTYFLTRIDALEQHHEYTKNQLAALTPEEIRQGREGSRKRVDLSVERLEDYTGLAQLEAKDLTAHP